RIAAKPISRRDFLRISGGAGVGLVLNVGWLPTAAAQGSGAAAVIRAAGVETVDATGFVKIAPDNTVTVMIKHLEMGQGPYTGLATLVAEELDADWKQMRAEGAPANNALYKNLALIGKRLTRLDANAKSSGQAMFTIDVQRPEALTVLVAHPPRFGGKVVSFDDSAARRVRGFIDAKSIPQGVAVYATGFWAAKKAREALKVQWDDAGAERRSTDELITAYRAAAQAPDVTATNRGNVRRALQQGARVIEA